MNADKLVQNDVFVNVSQIIEALELDNVIWSTPDFDEALLQYSLHHADEQEKRQISEMERDEFTPAEILEELAIFDPEEYGGYREALEFWAVSPYLGRKLQERGEMVEYIHGLTVWGRTTSGQAIAIDAVIQEICNL